MAFFKGQETYSLDSKGRVNIPAKMRRSIEPEANETFTLTRGIDKCILAYPQDEWKKYEEKFQTLNQYDDKSRYFLRVILPWSEEVAIDAQQRIMLPKQLLEYGGIEGKVKIVGMIDHIEFWNPEEFESYMREFDVPHKDVAKEVMVK
jgi:MraZ protein